MNKSDKKELAEYKIDMKNQAYQAEIERKEELRREFSQKNGSDIGYDPYWYL